LKILVVEDDKELGNTLVEVLKREIYEPKLVHCGKDAISAVKNDEFDLIVLDINLPDINGIELLQKMRLEYFCKAGVLILSARGELGDRIVGLDSGADDYLAKPFSIVELLARLRAILRRQSPNKQTKISYKNIEIDISQRSVQKDGEPVSLTPKEFMILELFFYNTNLILTPSQIVEHIYSDYVEKSSHIINMHISNIRQKLSDQTLIETVRGVGFRLNI
jgi:DNA-binding response OmpR family regulator